MTRPRVCVLATGGTIATVTRGDRVSLRTGEELLAEVPEADELAALECRDLLRLPSHLMGLDAVELVARTAVMEAAREDIGGVVVLHGTDILEEVAFLADLWHGGDDPIVFTGAQRPAGHPVGDGPANIRDAILVAASEVARDVGVLVCLGGTVIPAAAAGKRHTASLEPFGPARATVGQVAGDAFLRHQAVARRDAWPVAPLGHRVDLVRLAAGTDGALVRAAADAGAAGIVLEAFGAGTAPMDVVTAVDDVTRRGTIVLLASRCESGGVWSQPGDGSANHFAAVGAVAVGDLDGAKARMLLLAALATSGGDPEATRKAIEALTPTPA
ncbi:asparaginase domain-containing protein [Egibacter rhizosphaerae]|uniref:asparaginase domain-containing protein n=1 Tax=Egibacter rhizosphaerae TaxID=1670831 RepID=UPI0013F1685A|nr:asparaginase domain-containing protein [Egibacter rhizosphaerae]